MKESVVIIGGGMGGLFTGALLAKNDIEVTVLEKNNIIGGGLQCFERKNKIFETGMHVMGGFEADGTLTKICRYLGILDELRIHHINHEVMDEITYERTNEKFRIPSGREAFVKRMSVYFPHEADNIQRYVDELYRIADEVPLFFLKEESEAISSHSEAFLWSADRLISEYIRDAKLKEIMAYLNPLYGGVRGHSPAYIHALINVLYINGASRFIGGSQQLADALKNVIENNGGRVYSGKKVVEIDIKDKNICGVRTHDGATYEADRYISAIHPRELLNLLPQGTFPGAFVKRLKDIPLTVSAFTLFIDLKPDALKYIDHTCYYIEDFGSIWTNEQTDAEDWPKGFMYITPPDENQGEYASRLLVHCIMNYDDVRRWENTSVGKRGREYERWKSERIEKILGRLERALPGIHSKIKDVYAASPLTIRDYYNTPEGAIFGNRKDCENIILSQLSVYTKIRNLLLTGQNINLHGICGVPLTAINTAEAILGTNTIVRQIGSPS